MRKSIRSGLILLAILVTCLGTLIVFEAQTKYIRRAIDDFIYDNRNHYLPCEKLPAEEEVDRVLKEHPELIRSIEQVHPGFVGVDVDPVCAGKADLLIWYASHQDRVAIESMIDGDTFFGVPYRLQNR